MFKKISKGSNKINNKRNIAMVKQDKENNYLHMFCVYYEALLMKI